MPISVTCPECEKKLKVGDTAAGKKIRCPACKAIVEVPTPLAAADEDEAITEVPRKKSSSIQSTPPSRKRRDEDEDEDEDEEEERRPKSRKRRDDYDDGDEEEEERRPRKKKSKPKRRSSGRPHRGTTILLMGIGSMMCCIPLVAWILGFRAISMANEDIADMESGRMDDSGQTNTQIGKVCGIIGCVMGVLWVIIGVVLRVMDK